MRLRNLLFLKKNRSMSPKESSLRQKRLWTPRQSQLSRKQKHLFRVVRLVQMGRSLSLLLSTLTPNRRPTVFRGSSSHWNRNDQAELLKESQCRLTSLHLPIRSLMEHRLAAKAARRTRRRISGRVRVLRRHLPSRIQLPVNHLRPRKCLQRRRNLWWLATNSPRM